VTDSCKHFGLLRHGNYYGRKKFITQALNVE
jgi:hypothetical protein